MGRLKLFGFICLIIFCTDLSAQVRIRLFSNHSSESVVVSVTEGRYEINTFNRNPLTLTSGESVIISEYKDKLIVKIRNTKGFICDSLIFHGKTGTDSFSIRNSGAIPDRRFYSGDLQCLSDLGGLMIINICDVEKYISGVVMSEGGSGNHLEYSKTQAVLARTYMYKCFARHAIDRYNICDNTHCQVFNGLSTDPSINKAVLQTRDLVILAEDSTLIEAAFHSNCGGETVSSEDVWMVSKPYLKSVVDPYCLNSRNAKWEKSVSLHDWQEFIKQSGYTEDNTSASTYSFEQKDRLSEFKKGSVSIPLKTIRSEMNLRSTFFSLFPERDLIIFKGRGYGHGVGLCQEGAMTMANKGYNYKQIIGFYYSGVIVSNIKDAIITENPIYTPIQVIEG